ncbi:MAG: 50S ribosomal protein L22 [Candidatus Iainarchaeum archaeon]|uniref:Large ribosomal subunit protein uL22 n=1 Tax=Candidatus Iainarchaeum sp. TaxID=3101447 RepID=A0A497JES7_9ARCH|nr:MAG: 50S ribosomal protein L22 [Candidatus Diapherotrites archaeon]
MVKRNYQVQEINEKITAKAMLKNRPISLKYATEICREIKGKPVAKAEKFLNDIIEKKAYLPLKKYHKKVPHRKGKPISGQKAGKYPVNACKAFLELISYAKANAENKGLDPERLIIKHVFACQGYRRWSMQPKGRIAGKRRRKKSTHIEIVVQEVHA